MFGRRSKQPEVVQPPVERRRRDRSWADKVDPELASGAPGARMAVRILGPVLYELDGAIAELATRLEQKKQDVDARRQAREHADEEAALASEQVRAAIGPLENELTGRGFDRRVVSSVLKRLRDDVPPPHMDDSQWVLRVAKDCNLAKIPAEGLSRNQAVLTAVAAARRAAAGSEAAGNDYVLAEIAVADAAREVDALIDRVSEEVVPRLMKSLDAEVADAGAPEEVVADAKSRVMAVLHRRLAACKQAAGK